MQHTRIFNLFPPKQVVIYACVGAVATCVHLSLVYLFVENFAMHPLFANVFAFFTAFNVSYLGHHNFTFAGHMVDVKEAMRRYALVAMGGFVLNESLFYYFLQIEKFHYLISLLCVLMIVPPITFLLSKCWAFYQREAVT